MLRQLCWWASLRGEYSDSLLINGRMAHPLNKNPREARFLFSGNYGNLRRRWAYSRGSSAEGHLFHGHSREVLLREDLRRVASS